MGGTLALRNERNQSASAALFPPRSSEMADDREKISNGPNERPINETIAGTGPGIPDDAATPGEDLPEPPTDEEVERIASKLGAQRPEEDTLPLDGD